MAGGGPPGHSSPPWPSPRRWSPSGHDRGHASSSSGSRRGQDRDVLAGRGFPFTLLPGRGHRAQRCAPSDLVRNLAAPWPGWGRRRAGGLGSWPGAGRGVVVSVGGYASLPASLAARDARGPAGAGQRRRRARARPTACSAGSPGPARSGWDGHRPARVPWSPEPRCGRRSRAVGRATEDRRAARRALGLPPGPARRGGLRRLARARRINQRGRRARRTLGAARATIDLPHRRSPGLGRRSRPTGAGAERAARASTSLRVPYEERMAAVYAAPTSWSAGPGR